MTQKTLVCILAETRSHAISWDSFKKNVLDTLDADLALCISTPDGYDFNNDYWQTAKYHWVSPDYDDYSDGYELARQTDFPNSTDNWRKLLEIKDIWLGGIKDPHNQHLGSGGLLLYYRWVLWKNIRDNNLLEKYDRIVITRSDFIWECPHPPMDLLSPDNIWIPDGEDYNGYCDRHAVVSKNNIETYLNLIKPILSDSDNLYNRMKEFNPDSYNIERYIKFRIFEELGIQAVQRFPYIMYLARIKNGTTRWAGGVWNDELGYHIKYHAEFEKANHFKNIIKTKEDWYNTNLLTKN